MMKPERAGTRPLPQEAIMTELTEAQQRAVDSERQPCLLDPRTGKAYVLVPAEVYERLSHLLTEDEAPNMRQVAMLVERAMQEDDAGDPTLAFYQEKYGRKP
jgi:PHD/YefM family antitoxin component YafN of YafNO toxin-antitoxin module